MPQRITFLLIDVKVYFLFGKVQLATICNQLDKIWSRLVWLTTSKGIK